MGHVVSSAKAFEGGKNGKARKTPFLFFLFVCLFATIDVL